MLRPLQEVHVMGRRRSFGNEAVRVEVKFGSKSRASGRATRVSPGGPEGVGEKEREGERERGKENRTR